jgi:photosystem II stability/assembly factor-like uncharacterized protein
MMMALTAMSASILAQDSDSSANAKSKKEVHKRLAWFADHQEMAKASPYANFSWQAVGASRMGGRGVDVAIHPDQDNVIYLATASGGVWKSDDDGQNWFPIFDDYATASIGDLAIAPTNPDTVWVGTGEANLLRSTMAGTGVYRSLDGGVTFEHMGLTETHHISRIVIHPKNEDVVYVAASGHEYESNPERGVYKTTDGGKTWNQVFFQDDKTSVTDLIIDPKHPDTLYCGTAPRIRLRWNDPVGGEQTGLHKTVDGGATWTSLDQSNGLPDFSNGEYERVGLSLCTSQPETVYALFNHDGAARGKGGAKVYRSDDSGQNFHLIEGNEGVRTTHPGYGWFFGQIRVDPSDAETIYVMGLQSRVSYDGGYTWNNLSGNHVDYHGAWINPSNPKHIVIVNDGGIMISRDDLKTYHSPTNMPIAHNYNCAVGQEEGKFWIYCSTQDTGAWRGLVDLSRGRNSIVRQTWERATGDESGRHAVDPENPNIVYSVSRYGGGPAKTDYSEKVVTERRGRTFESYKRENIAVKWTREDPKRGQWVSPIIISPHDTERLLYAAQYVFLSDDGGKSWEKISDDLSNFDEDKQGNIAHAVVFSLTESPVEKGVIYAGTDDGNLHVTRDGGKTWNDVSEDLPEELCVASLEACHFEKGTVYAAINGKRHNEFDCLLYKSTDYGKTWDSITNNIPGSNANVIKQDPENQDLLFAGTDRGVYVSTDGGEKWEVLGKDLPTVYVHDLTLQTVEDFCVIATHGRGCYVLDIRDLRNPENDSE